jgi:hypothetical protein
VVELALAAPILALFIVGVTDISIAYGRELELEQGVQRSIERVMQTTGEDTVEDAIKEEAVCQVNGTDGTNCYDTPLDVANVAVTYRLECTDEGGAPTVDPQETTDSTAFEAYACPSEDDIAARYIRVTATETFAPLFSRSFGTAADGMYHLKATAGLRTQ